MKSVIHILQYLHDFQFWQKVRRIACRINIPAILQTELELNTTINNIELTSLEPYSEYQVKIYAFNEVKVGKGAEVSLQTEGIGEYFIG